MYGRPGPPEPHPRLPFVEFPSLLDDIGVSAVASSSWATKEGQSLSTMGQLLPAGIFTRAKAAAMAELQVLSFTQPIFDANKC